MTHIFLVSDASDTPRSLASFFARWIRKVTPVITVASEIEGQRQLPDLPAHILVDIGLRKLPSHEGLEVWERDGYRYEVTRQSHAPDPIRA